MKRNMKYNNCITYILLVVFLITGAGFGLGEECQVFLACGNVGESEITTLTFRASNEIHTFQVRERNSVTLRYDSVKNNYSETSSKGGFIFLCVLALLLVYFRLVQEAFVYYGRLYVRDRFYIIAFMQDIDGRKRIA